MKKEKLDILYEDKFLIIVNKKSGILTIANEMKKKKLCITKFMNICGEKIKIIKYL